MSDSPLITNTDRGLYCPIGDFYIDAWQPVHRTVITHAHSDHARPGSARYLTAADGVTVLQQRMGETAKIDSLDYGAPVDMNGIQLSLHPAGHILGSLQVRLEYKGEVWVFTGDFKRQPDPTCRPFELVPCHTLISECTFGLPIFRWQDPQPIFEQINQWWRQNQSDHRNTIIIAYALGKAQRVLANLDPAIGPILLHGAMMAMVQAYRQSGVWLPPAEHASAENAKLHKSRAVILAPASALGGTWIRKFLPVSDGIVSGWMQIRGFRRRRSADRGFVISDHADWPTLLQTIKESGAENLILTHGFTTPMARYLSERGVNATTFQTNFKNEGEQEQDEQPSTE